MSNKNDSKVWWQEPLRVIQPNLQVRDTDKIIPGRLAEQMEEAGANAIVFNVGGIYGWYPTKVPFHTQNPFLPTEFDLLGEIIRECHQRDIKVIARFDFSKAEDSVFMKSPFWFVRDPKGEPEIIGLKRPGEWSLLMSTCINSEYRRGAVAIPVLDEVFASYDIDGIFYNNPGFIPCWCETCKSKYRALYGRELPEDKADFDPRWLPDCERDNITQLFRYIKSRKPDMPVVLYYGTGGTRILNNVNNSDMFCTESQDYLSWGWKELPSIIKPLMTMKVGHAFEGKPAPFGIIHSSPGMDWRHTGVSSAEYIAWQSQIPANGGSVWHSITGVPDTIPDKRIMKTVAKLNHWAKKVEGHMHGAALQAETALLWDGSKSAEAWASVLVGKQIQFNVLLSDHADLAHMQDYRLVIVPEEWRLSGETAQALRQYVQSGGKLIFESTAAQSTSPLCEVLGITGELARSEYLQASYLRFEGADNPAQKTLEEVALLAHRGHVLYCRPGTDTQVLATLVPPFAPMDAVFAPPERASIPVEHTELPLVLRHAFGAGEAVYLPFSLSTLIREVQMEEHYRLAENLVALMLGDNRLIQTTSYQGLQVSVFEKGKSLLVHMINNSGRRPIQQVLPLHDIEILCAAPDVISVKTLLKEGALPFEKTESGVRITIPKLEVWECLLIERA